MEGVETNIVLAHFDRSIVSTDDLIRGLEETDILVLEISVGSRNTLRLVTHHEIGADEADRTVDAVAAIMKSRSPSRQIG